MSENILILSLFLTFLVQIMGCIIITQSGEIYKLKEKLAGLSKEG